MPEPGYEFYTEIELKGEFDENKPREGQPSFIEANTTLVSQIGSSKRAGQDITISDTMSDVIKKGDKYFLVVDVRSESLIPKNQEKSQRGFSSSKEAYDFAQVNNIAVADTATGRYVPGGRGATSTKWEATHEIVPDPYGDRFIIREKQEPQRKNRIIQDAVTGGWIIIDENNPYADPIPIGDAPDPVN